MSKVKWTKIGDGWYGDHIYYTITIRPKDSLWQYSIHPLEFGQGDISGRADTPDEARYLAERVMRTLETLKGVYDQQ